MNSLKYHLLAAAICCASPLHADVKMPAIFGDHMLLQQEAALPIWGTADAGEQVTVAIGSDSGSATADATGKWLVKLPPLPAGTTPLTMTVTGKNTLKFEDVLVGDVWLAGGQSNMEFALHGAHNAKDAVPQSADPQLRLFIVKNKSAVEPQTDVEGKWMVASPDTVPAFSAIAYFFAHELRAKVDRPIGVIGSYWGGTPAQAWISESGLQKEPPFDWYVKTFAKLHADYPKALADYPAQQAAFETADAQWKETNGAAFAETMKEWSAAVAQARAANQVPPEQPKAAVPEPKPPVTPDGGKLAPVVLYNGMIAPLIPYAIKGVIWYQGENNTGLAKEYETLFPRLITDWREKWVQGDFPFLFVQLARFNLPWAGKTGWAHLREAQLKSLSVPNTAMAVAFDVGDPNNIHPLDKYDVGLRLALAAEHVVYGKDVVYSGPIYKAMQVMGNSATLSFTQTGSGLIIGTAPWVPQGLKPIPNDKLVGFQIAGDDKNWFPADAKIDGETVIVTSPQVAQPVAVRYAWGNAPDANLYNKEALPASPFRTDDWPDPAPPPKP